MIGIELDEIKQFLETNKDTQITLRLENPFFFTAEKISPGSYSLPFGLPSSNFAKLKNPHVIENNEDFAVQSATLYASSDHNPPIPFKKGKINVESIKGGLYTFFSFGLNTIRDDFKTAKLRDVLSQIIVINSDAVVRKIHTDCQQINIVVNGIDYTQNGWYYSADPIGIAGPINKRFPPGPTTDYVPFISRENGNSPGNRITVPHWVVRMVKFQMVYDPLYLTEVLTPVDCTDPNVQMDVEITQDAGTFIAQPVMDGYYDSFITWLEPYLTNVIPAADYLKYLRFPTIASSQLNESKQGILINHGDGQGNIIPNTPEQEYAGGVALPGNVNSLQPFVNLKGVLQKIADYFGFEYEGDFWEDSRLDETLLWNTTALDLPQEYVCDHVFNLWRRFFNFNELVPDVTVVDFFKLLQSSFNIGLYFNERTGKVRMKWRENVAKAIAYEDITARTSPRNEIIPVKIDKNDPVASLVYSLKEVNLSVLHLHLDVVNTIVAGLDITVATVQDESLYEFSYEGGAWQSSNVLTVPDYGIYIVKVRLLSDPTVIDSYVYAVNDGDPDFDFTTAVTGDASANEAVLTITLSELPTTFEFSIDAGVTWQDAWVFNDLGPGIYYVAVRDETDPDKAVARAVRIDKDYDSTVYDFNHKQGDSFNLQFLNYEGLTTIDGYTYPYVSEYEFPSSPIWDKMESRMLSVAVDITLSLKDFLNMDWELKRRFDRVNYLYKSFEVKITNTGIKVTETELYTMR